MNKCDGGVEITDAPCPKCGAGEADLCGEADGTTYPNGLEIVRLRAALETIADNRWSEGLPPLGGVSVQEFAREALGSDSAQSEEG